MGVGVAPSRYLVAYVGDNKPAHRALLRFPLGVTLEDSGCDWGALFDDFAGPILPQDALDRLSRLGVQVAAIGQEAVSVALWRAIAGNRDADLGVFAEDYFGVNDRLGGGRCVTVDEYAMHTTVSEVPLRDPLMDHLRHKGNARVYGGAAFREGEVPDVLRLRAWGVARNELSMIAVRAPCGLHGDMCAGYSYRWRDPSEAIRSCVPRRHLGVRVALPRRLLDGLAAARDSGDARRVARAALPVALQVLDALPEGAKEDARSHSIRFRLSLASLVALAAARTCEEHAMLVRALWGCGSLREMVRRARDAAWAVSRALEAMS